MFIKSAQFYDLVYLHMKDYAAEARAIQALINDEIGSASTVLDVACGTGEHGRLLREGHGISVDGVDLDPGLIELARKKNPNNTFVVADMADFELSKEYDAVVCMFSSIGYADSVEKLNRTVANLARHAKPDGLVLVEPWLEPGRVENGFTTLRTFESDDLKLARVSRNEVTGTRSILHFEYVVATREKIEHVAERHVMTLFTHQEYLRAFSLAGLEVQFDPEGPGGRGLFVARKRTPFDSTD